MARTAMQFDCRKGAGIAYHAPLAKTGFRTAKEEAIARKIGGIDEEMRHV